MTYKVTSKTPLASIEVNEFNGLASLEEALA
jgi:hypothetical protein